MGQDDNSNKKYSRWLNNREFKSIIKSEDIYSNNFFPRNSRQVGCLTCRKGKKM